MPVVATRLARKKKPGRAPHLRRPAGGSCREGRGTAVSPVGNCRIEREVCYLQQPLAQQPACSASGARSATPVTVQHPASWQTPSAQHAQRHSVHVQAPRSQHPQHSQAPHDAVWPPARGDRAMAAQRRNVDMKKLLGKTCDRKGNRDTGGPCSAWRLRARLQFRHTP